MGVRGMECDWEKDTLEVAILYHMHESSCCAELYLCVSCEWIFQFFFQQDTPVKEVSITPWADCQISHF